MIKIFIFFFSFFLTSSAMANPSRQGCLSHINRPNSQFYIYCRNLLGINNTPSIPQPTTHANTVTPSVPSPTPSPVTNPVAAPVPPKFKNGKVAAPGIKQVVAPTPLPQKVPNKIDVPNPKVPNPVPQMVPSPTLPPQVTPGLVPNTVVAPTKSKTIKGGTPPLKQVGVPAPTTSSQNIPSLIPNPVAPQPLAPNLQPQSVPNPSLPPQVTPQQIPNQTTLGVKSKKATSGQKQVVAPSVIPSTGGTVDSANPGILNGSALAPKLPDSVDSEVKDRQAIVPASPESFHNTELMNFEFKNAQGLELSTQEVMDLMSNGIIQTDGKLTIHAVSQGITVSERSLVKKGYGCQWWCWLILLIPAYFYYRHRKNKKAKLAAEAKND